MTKATVFWEIRVVIWTCNFNHSVLGFFLYHQANIQAHGSPDGKNHSTGHDHEVLQEQEPIMIGSQ